MVVDDHRARVGLSRTCACLRTVPFTVYRVHLSSLSRGRARQQAGHVWYVILLRLPAPARAPLLMRPSLVYIKKFKAAQGGALSTLGAEMQNGKSRNSPVSSVVEKAREKKLIVNEGCRNRARWPALCSTLMPPERILQRQKELKHCRHRLPSRLQMTQREHWAPSRYGSSSEIRIGRI